MQDLANVAAASQYSTRCGIAYFTRKHTHVDATECTGHIIGLCYQDCIWHHHMYLHNPLQVHVRIPTTLWDLRKLAQSTASTYKDARYSLDCCVHVSAIESVLARMQASPFVEEGGRPGGGTQQGGGGEGSGA